MNELRLFFAPESRETLHASREQLKFLHNGSIYNSLHIAEEQRQLSLKLSPLSQVVSMTAGNHVGCITINSDGKVHTSLDDEITLLDIPQRVVSYQQAYGSRVFITEEGDLYEAQWNLTPLLKLLPLAFHTIDVAICTYARKLLILNELGQIHSWDMASPWLYPLLKADCLFTTLVHTIYQDKEILALNASGELYAISFDQVLMQPNEMLEEGEYTLEAKVGKLDFGFKVVSVRIINDRQVALITANGGLYIMSKTNTTHVQLPFAITELSINGNLKGLVKTTSGDIYKLILNLKLEVNSIALVHKRTRENARVS